VSRIAPSQDLPGPELATENREGMRVHHTGAVLTVRRGKG
jgi:hypothetical protein